MLTDGAHKWKGRFLKKGTKVFDKVQVERYNFAEIRRQPVIYPDNPGYNIIHQRLHDEEEISQNVGSGAKALENLVAKNLQAPVIFPRDFTKDWQEEKRKARKRHAHKDIDDDEFEMAMEEEEEKERRAREEAVEARSKRSTDDDHTGDVSEKSEEESGDKEEQTPLHDLQNPQFMSPEPDGEASSEDSLEKAGQELQKFATDLSTTQESPSEGEDQSGQSGEQQPPPDSGDAENLARQEGYQSGYEAGKAEAEKELREQFEAENRDLLSVLRKGTESLQNLQKEILGKAQDNFYEIAGALTESVFEKALKADPGVLKTVIEKAVKEGLDEEQITVKVSPGILERMKQSGVDGIDDKWQADPKLADTEFSISSGDSSLQSNFKDIVASLLSDVDISLYDQNEGKDDEEEQ